MCGRSVKEVSAGGKRVEMADAVAKHTVVMVVTVQGGRRSIGARSKGRLVAPGAVRSAKALECYHRETLQLDE